MSVSSFPRSIAASLVLAGAVALGACGDSGSTSTSTTSTSTSTSTSMSTSTSTTTSTTTSTSSSTSTGTGGNGGGAPAAPTFVAALDPSKGELAEGLYVKGSTAYVGLAALGAIDKVALPGGAVTSFGSIPTPPMNGGFLLGIVVDSADNVFVGFGGGPGDVVKNGIYKIPAAGGAVTAPFATNAEMNFPNGLWLDASSDIYVADSGGAIFKVKADGTTTKWTSDPSLVGTDMSCANGAPFALGANGIVRIADAFYVSNTNLGSVVKIPIKGDGTAGTAAVIAGPDCDKLGGLDGIGIGADGNSIVGIINSRSEITSIGLDGKITPLFTGKPLDNPASVWVVGHDAYITNSAFFDSAAPAPGLLEYPLK